jgi:basic membrane protein A
VPDRSVTPGGGRRLRRSLIGLLVVVALASLASCSNENNSNAGGGGDGGSGGEKERLVWLFYGPKDDGGWNTANHTPTEQMIKDELGDQVEQVSIDNMPYSAQLTQIANQAARDGADMIIDTAAGGDLFSRACKRNPDVACMATNPPGPYPNVASSEPENVAAVYAEFWTLEYLVGVAAGLVTESNTLGYVAPYEIPIVLGSRNAFLMGCQSVNPECVVRTVVTNNYFDPPGTNKAANTLVDAGADVLHGYTDDPTYCQVAERRGVRAIGQYSDYSESCPEAWITGPLWQYGEAYLNEAKLLAEGKWTGHRTTWLQLGDGADVADLNDNVPEKVRTKFEEVKQKLLDGFNPFVGPIEDVSGRVRVPEGEQLTKDVLYRKWTWKLKGTVGK